MLPSRRLAAVWFADLVGYSRLSAEDERTALRVLQLFQSVAREGIEGVGGHVVKFVGDAVFAEFGSVETAVRCALALTAEWAARSERTGRTLGLRIGLHVGDVIASEDGDLYGDGVNIAARLQGEAEPGQVLVSEDVWRQLRARPEYRFTALGQRELKGIPGPVTVFGVEADPIEEEAVPAPGEASDRAGPSSLPTAERESMPRARALAVPILLTLIVGSAVLAYSRYGGDPVADPVAGPAVAAGDALSLAVLPFDNLSDSRTDEYFAEGVATEILNTLALVPELRVAGQTSSFSFKGKDLPLEEIASRLGVRYLLEGNVRREADRVRIAARLVDATSGFQLWNDTYDRRLSGMLDVQAQIARSIAAALRVRLGAGADSLRRSTSPEAYDLYLRGVYEFRKRDEDPLAFRRALAAFERAVALDSTFASAHAGLARAQVVASAYAPEQRAERSRRDAMVSARRALALDSTLAEARSALAYALWSVDRDYAGADREFKRALAANPNDPTAHQWYGSFLRFVGRGGEAVRHGEESIALDPFASLAYTQVGQSYALVGRDAEAEAALDGRPREVGLPPRYAPLAYRVYARQRKFDEARDALKNAPERAFEAYVEAMAGRPAEARRLMASVDRTAMSATFSFVFVALGERDSAFASLDRWASSPALHHTESPYDPRLAPLHDDPRWAVFMRRMKLPWPTGR